MITTLQRFKTFLRRYSLLLIVGTLLIPGLAACQEKPVKTTGVSITGLDHLAEHLSIQNFWVDGTAGQQAGGGGSQVCCATIPSKWQPGTKVNVRWAVTNWKRRVYTMYERVVEVEKYDTPASVYVHFLRDGSVKVLSFDGYPEKPGYPGPSYDTVLKKQPWKDYKGPADEPLFTEVKNAMEDEKE
jgi:Protein of unknown function (DUF3304)